MKRKTLLLLLLFAVQMVSAQTECFTYDDDGQTIIKGLSSVGEQSEELVIPRQVTAVLENSFAYAQKLTTLTIEGNPTFHSDTFGTSGQQKLETLNLGQRMTVANIESLLSSIGTGNKLADINIDGYANGDGEAWKAIQWDDEYEEGLYYRVLRDGITVTMPAAILGAQVFGQATVRGIFEIGEGLDLATFCVSQCFADADDGSNYLFYIPLEIKADQGEPQVYVKRVHYIFPHQGFLMHFSFLSSSNRTVTLQRVDPDALTGQALASYEEDEANYSKNMLVGVTEATTIYPKETVNDTECTNMILYQGSFYRISQSGTLAANRAYLRVPDSYLSGAGNAKLQLKFPDDGETEEQTTDIRSVDGQKPGDNSWYTLSGQRLNGCPLQPGIYIHNGKKEVFHSWNRQ